MFHRQVCIAVIFSVALSMVSTVRAQTVRDEVGHCTFELPDGWTEVPAAVLTRLNDDVKTRMPNAGVMYHRAFQLGSATELRYPYILLQNTPANLNRMTYDQLEDALSKSLGTKVKSVEKGMSDVASNFDLGVPVLDRTKNVFSLTIKMDVTGIGTIRGYTGGHLSASGNLMLHSYARAAEFEKYMPVFRQINDSVKFDPGQEFKPGTGGFNWSSVLDSSVMGGVVGAIVGVFFVIFRKKKGTNV